MAILDRLRMLMDELQGLGGAAGTPARSGRLDVIGMAVDAVLVEARGRKTGDLLVLPDLVTIGLPEPELDYWNLMASRLRSQIEGQVKERALRGAGKREVVGGGVSLRLILTEFPVVSVGYSGRPISLQESDPWAPPLTKVLPSDQGIEGVTVDLWQRLEPPSPPRYVLQVLSRGEHPQREPVTAGLQIGRDHRNCALSVPQEHTLVSRVAVTVQHVDGDRVRLLVHNANGAWLDTGARRVRVRSGETVTLRPGQQLLLDSDARSLVCLVDTQAETQSAS